MEHRPIPEATMRELWFWLLRQRHRLRVDGESMAPTLSPGDIVFVDRGAYRRQSPANDDVVAAMHPDKPGLEIVKRVAFLEKNGDCYLLSDNPAVGTDSRIFGAVPRDRIRGRVTARVSS